VNYDFILTFAVKEPLPDDLADSLWAAGCDDALLGLGRPGRLALHFTRGAVSADQAVSTAVHSVKGVLPSSQLLEAAPDYVGLSDIADLVGVSRQNMRKFLVANPATFPSPIHDGNPSLWHLAPVLEWLKSRKAYEIDAHLLEIATVNMNLNVMRQVELLLPRSPVGRRRRGMDTIARWR
jgi:predicted DNA-binding transcriptional regulator AlpA